MKLCPAPMARAFLRARSSMASSVPEQRTRHLPEASQKASPKRMPGTAPTRASWMSSTDLMKWVWPKMKLISSGLSMVTLMSCMRSASNPHGKHSQESGASVGCAVRTGHRARQFRCAQRTLPDVVLVFGRKRKTRHEPGLS
ncbi:hypothetical protein FQZ97_657930 [compost metagenome]